MTTLQNYSVSLRILKWTCWVFILTGIVFRFLHILQNNFIFYDEGMYLSYNRGLVEKIAEYPPKDAVEFFAIIKILFSTALMTPKWLWFFIGNLRAFFGGHEVLYFTRIVSAVCGVFTIYLTYAFANRYFKSKAVGLLSAAILAVLPSHVFYSRLAMQESLSTLCLLTGMYLYFSSPRLSARLVMAAVFFSAVFFTNYRMIILPLLLIAVEWVVSLAERKPFNRARIIRAVIVFFGIIFLIGSLNGGVNILANFGWMTYQAADAPKQWHWLNPLSFPYGLVSLEGLIFGIVFFLNGYWFYRKDWAKVLPFVLVAVQMLIFSAAAEKGVRYLCVVMPFAAMAAAIVVHALILHNQSLQRLRWTPVLLCLVLMLTMAQRSWVIAQSGSGYQKVVSYIKSKEPQAKFIATQPLILSLFMNPENITAAPKTVRDLIILYAQGYRYLVIDPQAYVSWTADGKRFTSELVDYLGFIRDHMKPLYVADHLNKIMLARFVLDHNENLINSVRFLNQKNKDFGAIYIYDLEECLSVMQRIAQSQK